MEKIWKEIQRERNKSPPGVATTRNSGRITEQTYNHSYLIGYSPATAAVGGEPTGYSPGTAAVGEELTGHSPATAAVGGS